MMPRRPHLKNSAPTGEMLGIAGGILVAAYFQLAVGVYTIAGIKVKETTTNKNGEFSMTGIPPGKYNVKAIAETFGLYDNTEVNIAAGKNELPVILPAK